MIILFQNTLFLKEFLQCNGCLGLFIKIKKGSWASFCCTFSASFFHENVPYLILCQWTKFQCHTLFLSQDIKQNVLLNSYLDSWWRHKSWDFSKINLLSNGWQGKKEGRRKYKNLNISRTKSFLDEIKNIFPGFWRAII